MRLIDADKLITEIKREYCEECIDDICDLCWVTEYIELLTKAPTVEAEPIIHAKWIDAPNAPAYKDSYKCSECYTGAIHDMNGHSVLTRYCSHCGAKMNKHHNRMGEVEYD